MNSMACGAAMLLLCATGAAAQSQTSSPNDATAATGVPDTTTSPPNVADHPGSNGASASGAAKAVPSAQLPGVTVTKRNDKPCAKNDPACYQSVSAEIWRKYPEQIATMCKNERIRVMRQGFDQVELGAAPYEANTRLTPQTEALCDYGPAHGLAAK